MGYRRGPTYVSGKRCESSEDVYYDSIAVLLVPSVVPGLRYIR